MTSQELSIGEQLDLSEGVTVGIRMFIVLAALLAAGLMVWLNMVRRRRSELTSFGQLMTRVGVTFVFLAVAWGTIESHFGDVPPAPRMFVTAGALIWADVGLIASVLEQRRGSS